MALLNQNGSYSVHDFLFIAVGMLGLFAFFMSYGSQDPRSMLHSSLDESSATLEAAEIANRLGFNTGDFRSQVNFETNIRLLDSLQHKLGRKEAVSLFRDQRSRNLYPYFWEVRFTLKNVENGRSDISFGGGQEEIVTGTNEFLLRLAPSGEWIEFVNSGNLMPDQQVNRDALLQVFEEDSTLGFWNSLADSAWMRTLSFDLDQGYNSDSPVLQNEQNDSKGDPYQFNRAQVLRLSEYYLDQAGWGTEQFEVSNIRIETLESAVIARIRYESVQSIHGQLVNLQLSVTPGGALTELRSSYNPAAANGSNGPSPPSAWELVTIACIFLFGIGTIFIFYFRIRARVIDTKSALVFSILAGFVVPVVIFLNEVNQINLFEEGSSWVDVIGLLLTMGMTGALASVAFFIISAVGDSLTRQYWPEKLDCYDYLRQGMFFNKPVGNVLVRSVILMSLLAGFWSALIWLFPNLYLEIAAPFWDFEVVWPPIYLVLDNFWYSLIVAFGIFLVVGPQIYAQTSNRWIAGAGMILAVAIAEPLPYAIGPSAQQFLLLAILGAALTFIYLYWDFLTLFVSHFLFSCLLAVSSGWMVGDSPDFYLFLIFLLFLAITTVGGIVFIVKGKEEQALPNYVPEYVEELAQEERIKQELQIARDVQQSFLPLKTPAFNKLDLAAICKPAYETGGDYYDFIQLDEHRLGVAIGDVSGKGIQAAFYMTFTKGILHTLCREIESPAEVLKKANKLFYENARRGTFISLIYGIVDTQKMTFTFARAGHNPILHLSSKTGSMELLQPNGLGLGLTLSESFDNNIQETTLDLFADDLLVLYTDGVVESMNTSHHFYGTNRLQQLLKKKDQKSANSILSDLVNDVTKFVGQAKQHDDMTVMVIKLTN